MAVEPSFGPSRTVLVVEAVSTVTTPEVTSSVRRRVVARVCPVRRARESRRFISVVWAHSLCVNFRGIMCVSCTGYEASGSSSTENEGLVILN